jgi:carboxypeptidase family protein/TonB-dependent receptor-like protein
MSFGGGTLSMVKQKLVWRVAVFVFLFGGITLAQVTTGTISGTVKDSTGAVLPGATVVLLNEDTGISRTVQADTAGRYAASSLSLGNYRVTATLEGFQTEVRTGIVLTVAREAVVDLALSVGAVTQTVEVAGEASVVETTNATVSGLVNQDQIRDLPLNGRSFSDLALLTPGVIYNRTAGTDASSGFGLRLSVNGSRAESNLYLMDGTVMNNDSNNAAGAAQLSLGVESIREFRVLTHNFGAEYGRNSGAVVSLVTRSGTNQLHGSVYEFVRNNVFDARDFFNIGALPPFRRNQFGAAAGGPVRKDRIFFFANYEGLRQRQALPNISSVPDANARQGLVPDPITHELQRVPVSPQIVPYLPLWPLPNGPNFGDGTAQYVVNFSSPTTEDYTMERMDFRLSDKDDFFWRYVYDPSSNAIPRPVPTFINESEQRNYFAVLSETHIFSGSALNDFRFSFNRSYTFGGTSAVIPIDPSLSFVPGQPMGVINFTNGNSIGGGSALSQVGSNFPLGPFVLNLFQESEAFTLIRGAHTLKFGGDFTRSQLNTIQGGSYGQWTFNGGLTGLLTATPSILAGAFIGPTPNGGTSTVVRGFRRNEVGWFIQDDYRISSRLTLNLGFRHEFFSDPVEVNGLNASLHNVTDPVATVGPAFDTAKLNFAPRVGLAWDPTGSGKTSVRLGAGVYYNQVDNRTWNKLSADDSVFLASFSIRNPTTFPRVPPNTAIPLSTQKEQTVEWQLATPTVIHYGLDLQRQITPTLSAQLGYVGSYGYNETYVAHQDIRIATILPDGRKFFAANSPFVNPNFSTIEQLRAGTSSNYNGFQAMLQKTAGFGLVFQVSYSLSKALSEADEAQNLSVNNGGIYTVMDATNLGSGYGRSSYDQRQNLVFNGQYRMPWDHLLNGRLSKAALGGWEVNGIYSYGTGLPLNINLGFNNSQNGDPTAPDRPNLAPGFSHNPTSGVTAGCQGIPGGQKLGTPNRWYDPCAFTLSPLGTFGNLGRDTLNGPNFNQVNFTLVKNTPLTERKRLEFRAEFFNLFNHAGFGLPNQLVFSSARIHTGSEGVITSTTSRGRQIQLGLKLTF